MSRRGDTRALTRGRVTENGSVGVHNGQRGRVEPAHPFVTALCWDAFQSVQFASNKNALEKGCEASGKGQ